MQTFIIDNGSRCLKDLEKLLAAFSPEIIGFGETDIDDIPHDSFVVLSGGHTIPVLWHNDDYAIESRIIKNHTGPLLGVCLGAQLIAHNYGSHLHLLSERRKGLIDIRAYKNSDLLHADESLEVYESHNWSIKTLGSSLIPLAESIDGIECFRHESKPMYGLQFHPEYQQYSGGKIVFERVIAKLLPGF